ncbi:hypothetical protein DL96DRAFT_1574479 [Flagelloscypha sp. PMI_526]|nr:hypothetical protein DL96DRAFT_1574479 [Flagelloscypha sp. PMI_526]
MSHRYRGHRQDSFVAHDVNELVELRARQRTFYGAYSRTALSNLGYALTILRLFDRRFYKIGLLFAILGTALFILSWLRSRHSNHDFADPDSDDEDSTAHDALSRAIGRANGETEPPPQPRIRIRRKPRARHSVVIQTTGQCGQGKRVFGRPFVTAGEIVVAVGIIVFAAEIGLLALIIKL